MKLPQYYRGRHFGALLDTYQRTAGMLSAVQYVGTLIILYTTTIQPHSGISFITYLIIIFISIVVVMVGVYILGTPSSFAFWSEQIWKHNNPMRTKLEDLEQKQLDMDKKLDDILVKLNGKN